MTNLAPVLKFLFPNAPRDSWRVVDHGEGPQIAHWDEAAIGQPPPNEAALIAAEADYLADRETDAAKADRNRFGRELSAVLLLADDLKRLTTLPAWASDALTAAAAEIRNEG